MELSILWQRQSNPLDVKVQMSLIRIREWYEYWDGQVAVSFSGGKDSAVLLDLVRSIYPDVPAVFINTGLEYPENVRLCKQTDNCQFISPKMRYKQVIEKYGYPCVSKQNALYIYQIRNTNSDYLREVRLHGKVGRNGKRYGNLSDKWKFMLDAPFKISPFCCDVMKKRPAKKYTKETGRKYYIGNKASDSRNRLRVYLEGGCNSFDFKVPLSTPLGFWTDEDIWEYIKSRGIKYSSIYDMGYENTGCIFCLFGLHMESGLNRFQRLYETHPRLWKHCMEKLDLRTVMDFMDIEYRPSRQLELSFH